MSKNTIKEKHDLKRDEVNSKLSPRGIFMIGPIVSNNTKMKTDFLCDHGHQWSATLNNVLNVGRGCPHCAKQAPLSKEEINRRLLDQHIEMVGEYNGSHTKTEFLCGHDHRWMAEPNKVINAGTGCPECASHGFNPSRSGYLYAIDFGLFIKYGITNDLQRRMREHLKNGEHRVITTKLFEDGGKAKELERQIKNILGGYHATKEQCPDGYTETLCPSKLSELMAIIHRNI